METTTLPALNITSFVEVIEKAPDAIAMAKTSIEKAENATQTILDTVAAAGGMTAELDALCNAHLVKLRRTYENLQERRKPLTQLFDTVRKSFTEFEYFVDPKGKDNLYARVQQLRDDFARSVAEAQRKAQEELQKKIAREKETAGIQSQAEIALANHFNDYLTKQKITLMNLLDGMTLDNEDIIKNAIIGFKSTYDLKHYNTFSYLPKALSLSESEVKLIVKAVCNTYTQCHATYVKEIGELKEDLLDTIPSKRAELQAMAQASAKEKERLEKEAAERKQAQEEALKQKAVEDAKAAESAARARESAAVTQTLFDAQTDIQEVPQQAAQVREGYEIVVKAPAGFMQIAQFYFEKEGLKESVDKLEKKTLGSMKKFCESYAQKYGEKIQSPFVEYCDVYKAVAKR